MSEPSRRYVQSEESSAPFFSLHEVLILHFVDAAGIAAHVIGYVERVNTETEGPALFDFAFRNKWRSGGFGGLLTLTNVPAWRYLVDRLPNQDELKLIFDGAEESAKPHLFFRDADGQPVLVSKALEGYTPTQPLPVFDNDEGHVLESGEGVATAADSDTELRDQVNQIIVAAHNHVTGDSKLTEQELAEVVEKNIAEAVTELTHNEWRATSKTRLVNGDLVTDVSLFRVDEPKTFHVEANRISE
jgi:hypothetical protein